jgi:hypothetical protein
MSILQAMRYPASLGYEIKKAQLLYQTRPAQMDMETEKNGLKIRSSPVRLEIDNRAFFDSLGLKSYRTAAREAAQKGRQAALEATARYAREGSAMLGPDGLTVSQLAGQRARQRPQSELVFIPEKPVLSWQPPQLDIEYTPDQTHIQWDTGDVQFRYQPYEIHYYVDKWEKAWS